MIERKFIAEQLKEFRIQEFVAESLKNVGHSHTKLQRTPLGEKIVVYASRPGLVVGRKGENIKKLTSTLKKRFSLENPQIEISEVENIFLDAQIVAEMIASTMERFGSQKFKGIGHKMLADVTNAGALGIEIHISGKIPGARAKSWRFFQGYMKKCGDLSNDVRKAYAIAKLKSGVVGVKVSIMPPDIKLPDKVTMKIIPEESGKGVKGAAKEGEKAAEPKAEEKKKEHKKAGRRKKEAEKKPAEEKAAEAAVITKEDNAAEEGAKNEVQGS